MDKISDSSAFLKLDLNRLFFFKWNFQFNSIGRHVTSSIKQTPKPLIDH